MTIFSPDLSAPSPGERRRDSLFLLARMRVGTGILHDVRVRNLSAGGLMAEFDHPVTIDQPVSLEMRGIGKVEGRIAWTEQGRVGVAFDRPIDPKAARKPVGGGTTTPIYAKAPPRP